MSFFVLFPILIFAQIEPSNDFSYQVSNPYKVIDGRKVYFYKENQILSIKVLGETVFLQKTNSLSLELLNTNKVDLPSGSVVESIIELNKKYYLFYSLWDKPNKNEQLFYKEINFDQGTLEANTSNIIKVNHHLSRIPMDNIVGFWGHGISNKFHFKFSDNNSKLLIQYRYLREKRIDAINYDIIGINVFNQDVQLLWNKEVKMPYTEKHMDFHDNMIDHEGNVYILATIYGDNRNERAIPELKILKYQANSDTLFSLSGMDANEKFITSIKFSESVENQISFTGFYSEDPIEFQPNGLFILDMDKNGMSKKVTFFEYPSEFFEKTSNHDYNTDIFYDVLSRPEADYKIIQKLINDDGSVTILSEQRYIETFTTYSKSGRHETHTYHYNDILITKIDTEGKMKWMTKIPKEQVGSTGKKTMSFKYLHNERYHYILFFDNPFNIDASSESDFYAYKDKKEGVLIACKISDIDGTITRIPILNTEYINGMSIKQFYTDRIVILDNNEFILEAYKKKKEDILIKVKFTD